MRYVCKECSGRSGEVISFTVTINLEPDHCPFCGQCRYLVSFEAYKESHGEYYDFEEEA